MAGCSGDKKTDRRQQLTPHAEPSTAQIFSCACQPVPLSEQLGLGAARER